MKKNDMVNKEVPNNNDDYSKYIREHSDKSSNTDAVGLAISSIIFKIVAPIAFVFTVGWLIFGGLSGSESNYWTVLIISGAILLVSVLMPFIFTYRLAARDSSARDKKIFIIGIILLVIAIILFYHLYIKR